MTDSGNERVQKFGYPAVALTAPEAGDTVSGTLEVSADAYDPDGVEGARFELDGAADRITAGFSHGMGRRLSVLLAAFARPRLLLLDEPFDGVDPLGVDATLDVVAEARADGTAVLVSTHLLPLAVEACDEAVVLKGGVVLGAAPTQELSGESGRSRYRALIA